MTWRSSNLDASNEDHHRHYGREWCLGLDHYNFLIEQGLKRTDSFLDMGCGSLRTGIHVAKYLDARKYVAMDGHKESLDCAYEYEIPMNHLEDKKIRFILDDSFDRIFVDEFDVVFAFSVFIHLRGEMLDKAIRFAHDACKGILVLNNNLPKGILEYFSVEKELEQESKLSNNTIKWFVLKPKK